METQRTSGEEARKASARVAESVREQGESVAKHARETGKNVFNEQRAIVACSTQHVATALHSAAAELRERGESLMGSYTDWAANGLDRFSEQITREDFDGFISRASRFTRERPEIVFGGALLAGIAFTRLLKAGTTERSESYAAAEPYDPAMEPIEPVEPIEPIDPTLGTTPYRSE
jgi:hypothetical protein